MLYILLYTNTHWMIANVWQMRQKCRLMRHIVCTKCLLLIIWNNKSKIKWNSNCERIWWKQLYLFSWRADNGWYHHRYTRYIFSAVQTAWKKEFSVCFQSFKNDSLCESSVLYTRMEWSAEKCVEHSKIAVVTISLSLSHSTLSKWKKMFRISYSHLF